MNSLEALNKLNTLAFSFYTAGAVSAASNLGIFDHLGGDGLTPEALAEKVSIHPDGSQRLLSAMQNLELLELHDGRYRNSAAGAYLSADAAVPMSFCQKDNYFYHMWEYLPDALREYSPRHEQAWGQSASELYQAIFGNESQLRQFFKLLDSYNVPIGIETAERLNFKGFSHILDLAGGTGSFVAEVLKAHPHLKGTVLDLEPVKEVAEELKQRNKLTDRLDFFTGDMFKPDYPQGVDVIFLSYILHNWDEKNCIQILKNCFDALPSKGMVVISEKILNNDFSGDWWGVMMNLQMLIAFQPGAKERTENEYKSLLSSVGFQGAETIRLDAPRDLLIAFKP